MLGRQSDEMWTLGQVQNHVKIILENLGVRDLTTTGTIEMDVQRWKGSFVLRNTREGPGLCIGYIQFQVGAHATYF